MDSENECEARRANVCGTATSNNLIFTVNNYSVGDYISCIPPLPLFSVVCIKSIFLITFYSLWF